MDTNKKTEDGKEKKETPTAAAEPSGAAADAPANKPADDKPGEGTDSSGSASNADTEHARNDELAKKPGSFKQTLKRFRLYLLIVLLIVIVGGIFVIVSGLNKRKIPPPASVQSQSLTQSQLKQSAGSGTTASGQTITIQGNAVLNGQEVVKGSLYVAGDVQAGGSLNIPALTLSHSGSLGNAQAGKLQVANTATFQSLVTLQNGLNVNGNTSINTASIGTLTATRLIMNNGQITVPDHLAFTGAFPHRTVSFGVLGNGGSASVNGSDTNGTVTINTGNNPAAGCFISIIFNIPFAGKPNILLGPIGLGAGATEHSAQLLTSATTGATTGFKICTANTPLPNQAFAFSYLVNGSPN